MWKVVWGVERAGELWVTNPSFISPLITHRLTASPGSCSPHVRQSSVGSEPLPSLDPERDPASLCDVGSTPSFGISAPPLLVSGPHLD